MKILYTSIRFLLALIFFYSGMIKLFDLNSFAEIIGAYGLISESLNELTALFISLLEILGSILLAFDSLAGVWLILIMLLSFIIVLSYGVYFGLDLDCGCFGSETKVSGSFHHMKESILRDSIFILGVIYLFYYRIKNNFNGGENVSI